MSVIDAVKRPTATSSVASLLGVTAVLWLLLPGDGGRTALALELVGVGVVAGGATLSRRGRRFLGVPIAVLGAVTSFGAMAFALTSAPGLAGLIVTLPGVLGAFVLALGLVPLRGSGSRSLVKLGAGLAFASVLAAGLFRLVSHGTLLLAGVGVVFAWDAGERAINVGEQLGRIAGTRRLEAVHVLGSLVVGGLAVGAGSVVAGVGSPGLPLSALAALLVSVLLLTAALHA